MSQKFLGGQLSPEDAGICRTQQFLYNPNFTKLLEKESRRSFVDEKESHCSQAPTATVI